MATEKKTVVVNKKGAVKTAPVQKTVSEPETQPTAVHEKRTYEQTDSIECMSITSGELWMTGIKSGINYRWADRGDVTDVEYQDVVAAIRSGASFIFKPYFVIKDEELVSQFPQVHRVYESLYSINDLQDVLRLPVGEMRRVIKSLPDGAKESVKNIAATQISNGTLDSVRKIKVLDEIFDTKMMLMTELF